jgi:two-component system chemotaxis response regulator CheY
VAKILIVDDSPAARTQVSAILTGAGFVVIEAKDGLEALQMVKTTTDISLLIVDLHMPRMTGFELLAAMQTTGVPAIPSVMITTESRTPIVEKGKRAGARGWLVKPFKPEHLIAVARRLTSGGSVTGTHDAVATPAAVRKSASSSK